MSNPQIANLLLVAISICLMIPATLQQPIATHIEIPSGLSLNATNIHVSRGLDKGVVLSCNRTATGQVEISEVISLRIEKQIGNGTWRRIADVTGSSQTVTLEKAVVSAGYTNISKVVTETFLAVEWNVVTNQTFGSYRCILIGLDTNLNAVTEKSAIVRIREKELPTTFLLHLLLKQKDRMVKAMMELQRNINESSSKAVELGKEVEDIQEELTDIGIVSSQAFSWPRGAYALLKTDGECPFDAFIGTDKESIYGINTESSGGASSLTTVSQNIHLSKPIKERKDRDNFVYFRFCGATYNESWYSPWPAGGSYCINQFGSSCPTGFSAGHLQIDEEDEDNLSFRRGPMFADSYIRFCCKNGDVNEPIALPTSIPFYLYRNGGQCQTVTGMTVTEEYIKIDTEHNENNSAVSNSTPDIEVVKSSGAVTIRLCYYS